ncbi:MAG: Fe-S cluster assembly protein SufD [Alphaproteobacteria bacterium]|jgi:Fe-S cluster assembly protein SufD|nr:Fe-S cluster assembly protein SufD [Alphaproteobacteria bacterium]
MNAEVRQIKTNAELALAQAYMAEKAKLPGDGKVVALRDTAAARFDALGLPHRRIEEWKYTDLRALIREARPIAGAPDAAGIARAKDAGKLVGDMDARRVVFVDGTFVPELSDLSDLSPGLSIRSMAQALAAGDPLIDDNLGKVVPADGEGVVALNTALMRDGAMVHVAKGATVERPIHLVFAATGAKPASVFTRSLVVIGQGARVMLVESHDATVGHQVNTAMELVVGDSAHFDHIKITSGPGDLVHVSSLMAAIGANARFNDFAFNIGGGVVRNQTFVRFDGEGTLAGLRGASLLKGKQHVDSTLVVDHKAGGCQSREVFATVLDDESRGVFQGKIVVRPHAQQTDARMMTRALLLSDDAEADNKPELEIFADDVQCGHGATSGALDQDLKFYLMARGIPEVEAEALLVQAFVGEAIEGIEHAGLRDALMEQVVAWLRARGS